MDKFTLPYIDNACTEHGYSSLASRSVMDRNEFYVHKDSVLNERHGKSAPYESTSRLIVGNSNLTLYNFQIDEY
jgi:hypothetical protein